MSAMDETRTLGRARLSFATQADLDEFAATLEAFESGRSARTSGGPSAWCAASTASARTTCT
jgi:hypothetical protein